MKKLLIISFLCFIFLNTFASESAPCGDYGECETFKPQLNNLESLQLGCCNIYE